jgi:chitin synthase
VALALVLNCIMVFSILIFALKHNFFFPEEHEIPDSPETIVFLLPCYNETREELTKSLESLAQQSEIEGHKQSLLIICDGNVRGQGMEKTTADTLSQDILVVRPFRRRIKAAYLAWDHQQMDITIQKGNYKGLPYIAIFKDLNEGKRDGLILARSFLYNFNIRTENPQTRLSQTLFTELSSFLINDCGIENVSCLVGMDADTYFHKTCVAELLKESRSGSQSQIFLMMPYIADQNPYMQLQTHSRCIWICLC